MDPWDAQWPSHHPAPAVPPYPPAKLNYGQALGRYIQTTNKIQLLRWARWFLVFLAAYAPFAFLNDLLPFLVVDDVEIPFGIFAALRLWWNIRKYRNPGYTPRHWFRLRG